MLEPFVLRSGTLVIWVKKAFVVRWNEKSCFKKHQYGRLNEAYNNRNNRKDVSVWHYNVQLPLVAGVRH